jgi:hypothetical protein
MSSNRPDTVKPQFGKRKFHFVYFPKDRQLSAGPYARCLDLAHQPRPRCLQTKCVNMIDLSLPQCPVLHGGPAHEQLIFEPLPIHQPDKADGAYRNDARTDKSSFAVSAQTARAHLAPRCAVIAAASDSTVITEAHELGNIRDRMSATATLPNRLTLSVILTAPTIVGQTFGTAKQGTA